MPCHNQSLNNVTTGQEHNLTKHVRFAASSNSSSVPVAPSSEAVDDVDKQRLNGNCPNGGGLGPDVLNLGPQLKLLPLNSQILELQTIIRDKTTSRGDFVFCADRLIRLVVEEGLNQLPYSECTVTTPTGTDSYSLTPTQSAL
ncbi:unnamed protein product [Oncorhynchus mykiss]|uniref:Phosphoribosyltransferase domain-containing protein n=1 Tax=Oncorhynchus mykiss TaxID=8022 RepID=A0A060YUL6_ONCMY|nr:unnamed protein product [Oncorhynchus mykiss]